VFSSDTAPCEDIVALSGNADLLIHECAMDDETIAHRKKTKVGIVNHTTPGALGEIAERAKVKSLVAIHQGGKESTNRVLTRMMRHHMPDARCGPGYFDRTIEGIRRHYDGPLRVARDLMRIDL
jgi:ribonuclease Z